MYCRFTSHVVLGPVLVAVLATGSPLAHGQNYIVNTFSDTTDLVPGDGICADANGLCSLRAAIMEANADAGPVVILLPSIGNYTLTIGGAGGAAVGDLDISPTTPLTELQIIGQGAGNTFITAAGLPAGQPDRVFHLTSSLSAAVPVTLSGLTIQSGRATGFNGTTGGGILHEGGILKLRDVSIEVCSATDGAGLWSSGKVDAQDVNFSGHVATGDGGGFFLATGADFNGTNVSGIFDQANRGGLARVSTGAKCVIQGGSFSQNQATQGGAFRNLGTLSLTNLSVSNNTATSGGNGGALANQSPGSVTMKRVSLSGNSAQNGGGALNNQFNATVVAEECNFSMNIATNLGGAISNAGDCTLNRCGITSNRSNGTIGNAAGGGGIYNQNASGIVRAVNCTIDGNTALLGYGGGIANDFAGTVELSSCTLAFNGAMSGNTLFNGNTLGTVSIVRLIGTILDDTGSPPGANPSIVAPSPVNSFGFNIDADGSGLLSAPGDQSGTAAMPINTMLAPPTLCGPLSLTRALTPMPGSPAIDRGTCTDVAGNVITMDQCGRVRPVDGDLDGVAQCDVGAVELACGSCPGDLTGDSRVDGRDVQRFTQCLTMAGPISATCGCADMDGDGTLSVSTDLPLFVARLLTSPSPACP